MRKLTNYINEIVKSTNSEGHAEWTFYGDGVGDFEDSADEIPDPVLLKNYLKTLRTQASYVKELLQKSA